VSPTATTTAWQVLPARQWLAREREHARRADQLTAGHRERAQRREPHPVEDFLFTYYRLRPNQLRRWHPGVGGLDVPAFLAARGDTVTFVAELLTATASRPPHLGCFGLHEWAMVYRSPTQDVRHASWPLRLGREGTDAVVETHRIRCTHFDAFRFFTPAARPRNTVQPDRGTQLAHEQPGCLHAGMDLYKWAGKLGPAVPGELLLDCFELARDIRVLDMRAAPYDLTRLGYEPVRIETAEGKAEYVAAQRAFADRAGQLRGRLLDVCRLLQECAR
jgi:hypothetical protein